MIIDYDPGTAVKESIKRYLNVGIILIMYYLSLQLWVGPEMGQGVISMGKPRPWNH